jgi:hypothetical protein
MTAFSCPHWRPGQACRPYFTTHWAARLLVVAVGVVLALMTPILNFVNTVAASPPAAPLAWSIYLWGVAIIIVAIASIVLTMHHETDMWGTFVSGVGMPSFFFALITAWFPKRSGRSPMRRIVTLLFALFVLSGVSLAQQPGQKAETAAPKMQAPPSGDYKPLTLWGKIKLGSAYYTDPQLIQNTSVAYSFDPLDLQRKERVINCISLRWTDTLLLAPLTKPQDQLRFNLQERF